MASGETLHSDSLLLLQPAAFHVTAASVKSAYQDAIAAALNHVWLSRSQASGPLILDIIVPYPILQHQKTTPRSSFFPIGQTLVAGLYKLVALIATRDAIELDNSVGVDARVLILSYDEDANAAQNCAARGLAAWALGPVIHAHTLIYSGRTWNTIFMVKGDLNAEICAQLKTVNGTPPTVHVLPTASLGVQKCEHPPRLVTLSEGAQKHHHIAVGGTFDHLHIGHKLLLTMVAFALDPREPQPRVANQQPSQPSWCSITVGITGDALLKKKKYIEVLENWPEREKSVQKFLRAIMDFRPANSRTIKREEQNGEGPNEHSVKTWLDNVVIDCVEIWDPFGPTITDENLSVLVLSGETRSGGKAVNEKRNERSWPDLAIFEVDVLDAKDDARSEPTENDWKNKISSTEIRKAQLEKLRKVGKI